MHSVLLAYSRRWKNRAISRLKSGYNARLAVVSLSWLERSIHNADVAGSNPATTTKIKTHSLATVGFFF